MQQKNGKLRNGCHCSSLEVPTLWSKLDRWIVYWSIKLSKKCYDCCLALVFEIADTRQVRSSGIGQLPCDQEIVGSTPAGLFCNSNPLLVCRWDSRAPDRQVGPKGPSRRVLQTGLLFKQVELGRSNYYLMLMRRVFHGNFTSRPEPPTGGGQFCNFVAWRQE